LWVISYGIYPHTKIIEIGKLNLRKINKNTEIYVKKSEKKKHGGRDRFQYNNDDYNVNSLVC